MRKLLFFVLLGCFAVILAGQEAKSPPLRIGVVGYESHGVLFTKELNSGLGGKIGLIITHVWNRKPVAADDQKKYGFTVVDEPEAMIGKVDGVLITEALPFRYAELAAPFIRAGVRTFLNRPLAASAEEAAKLLKLGRDFKNPILAASALTVDPQVLAIRQGRGEYVPLKVVNVTGPSNHFWNYAPHVISALVSALGAGIEEVYAHDLVLDRDGITIQNPLVIFFRYSQDSAVGPVRGTLQMVPGEQPGDWYGFRMKLFGRKESPEYRFFETPEGESSWLPIYRLLIDFFRDGKRPFSDEELLEVPLVLDMVKKSGLEKRAVFRSEYQTILSLLK
jgi:predicted dehydrogenase